MRIFYWPQHYRRVQDCFERYQTLQQQPLIAASSIDNLEHLLRVHVAALALDVVQFPDDVTTAAQAFAKLSALFSAQQNINVLAEDYLTQENLRAGVIVAIKLFSLQELAQYLCDKNLMSNYPELFYIAVEQKSYIPDHVLRQALQVKEQMDSCTAAIYFATYDQRYGIAIFREFYQKLLTSEKLSEQELLLIPASLWAGILRNEINAKQCLAAALRALPNNIELHYYAALQAYSELLPQLQLFAERYPDPGLYFLALFGCHIALPALLSALKKTANALIAADAWLMLTGETLPLRPGLYDAKISGDGREQVLPAVNVAQQWLEQCSWTKDQRYLFGEPVSEATLKNNLCCYHGLIEKYLKDLLVLKYAVKNENNNVRIN